MILFLIGSFVLVLISLGFYFDYQLKLKALEKVEKININTEDLNILRNKMKTQENRLDGNK